MPASVQASCNNRLLALMSAQDFALLAPDLDEVALPKGFILVDRDEAIEYVYFPETSIASIIVASPEGLECEGGIVGMEGLVPPSVILGADRSTHRIIIQVPDGGYRIARDTFTKATNASTSLRGLTMRFAQVMNVQMAFTSLSNAVHPVDERLARWLLMCHDRFPSDDIPLTHEFMAVMLAVRRPSVTTALHVLEGNRLITPDRGSVTIRNRMALESFAGDSYGKPEAEYLRLIGPMKRSAHRNAQPQAPVHESCPSPP